MNKKQKTSIILTSLASIAVAGSLIVGGTYALFTSESETNIAVNSGTVNVVGSISDFEAYSPKLIAYDASSIVESTNIATKQTDGSYLFGNGGSVSLSDDGVFSLDKMTPGDKVSFNVNIKNKSNVAAKYRTLVKFVEDDGLFSGLYVAVGSEKLLFNEDKVSYFSWVEVPVGAEDSTIPLSIELPISAGNDYQNKNAKIAIIVEAVQGNAEVSDEANSLLYITNTNDNDYLSAKLEEKNLSGNVSRILYRNQVSEAQAAVSRLAPQTVITGEAVFDLSNKIVSVDQSNTSTYGNASPVLITVSGEDSSLTIDDSDNSGTLTCEAGESQVYGISVLDGATVTINGGNYYGAITAIQVTEGTLEINGGFFDLAPTCKSIVPGYSKFVVNCIDRYFGVTAFISIKGGTFVNFDPSKRPEGTDTTYVAEGYTVTSQVQENGDTWYTVVEDTGE